MIEQVSSRFERPIFVSYRLKRNCRAKSNMKIYQGTSVFQNTWQQLATAFWKRYPNDYSKHVLTEDVLSRHIDAQSGQLVTKRLLLKTNSIPGWIKRLMPSENVHLIEESIVDPICQTLITKTRNIGCKNILTVEETCTYKPHTENKSWTLLERSTKFESSYSGITRRAIERLGYQRYKRNIKQTDLGFRRIIESLFETQQAQKFSKGMVNQIRVNVGPRVNA